MFILQRGIAVLQGSHLNEREIARTAKLSFAAATVCLMDQYMLFDKELRFFSRYLYFISLHLKNIFLLDGAVLLLYGVKMWLPSDADSDP